MAGSAHGRRIAALRAPLALAAIATAANVVVLLPHPVPWLSPLAGCVLIFGLPICLIYAKLDWRWADPSERLGYSVVATLLLLMGMGLAIDIALPHVGVEKPLDPLPVIMATDAVLIGLGIWRPRRWPRLAGIRLPSLNGRDKTVLALCALVVLAAIAGAIRLNNGAGGGATLAMLLLAATVSVLLILWGDSLEPGVVTAAVYFIALALLLMTSLRGWYITGHDIQTEYQVFQLTKTYGSWSMSHLQNAYNACLSITVLPTVEAHVTRIADQYVYKLIFQIVFAYCPVLVYKLARRYTSLGIAVLAAIYFVSFPTFHEDMPFLNRQEVAFLFLAAALLMMATRSAPLRTRRVFIAFCSGGVVVAHYSTTYVLAGTLIIAWMLEKMAPRALPAVNGARRRLRLAPLTPRLTKGVPVIGLANIGILVAISLLWIGAYTQTYTGLSGTMGAVIDSIRGSPEPGSRSIDVRYSLLGFAAPSKEQAMRDYEAHIRRVTRAGRRVGIYYSDKLLSEYPTPIVEVSDLPVTPLGRAVGRTGMSASSLNSRLRAGAARLYQVFLAVGLCGALFSKRRRFTPSLEIYALSWAAAVIVAVQVLFPVLSIDFGVLRAFEQAMIVFSPFVAYGTVTLFGRLGDRWSLAAGSAVVVLLFLSLTGALPQLLGGYPPQLNLNNAGGYYDLYYLRPQELNAMEWLAPRVASRAGQVHYEVAANHYTSARLQAFSDVSPETDIWPTALTRNATVFLGFETIQKRQSAVSYESDLIFYRYPVGLLDRVKNRVYSSNGAWIYQ